MPRWPRDPPRRPEQQNGLMADESGSGLWVRPAFFGKILGNRRILVKSGQISCLFRNRVYITHIHRHVRSHLQHVKLVRPTHGPAMDFYFCLHIQSAFAHRWRRTCQGHLARISAQSRYPKGSYGRPPLSIPHGPPGLQGFTQYKTAMTTTRAASSRQTTCQGALAHTRDGDGDGGNRRLDEHLGWTCKPMIGRYLVARFACTYAVRKV